ncbi:MAG TPA: potassium channel family protein [Solirubrobacteraceae bacterium]|nr:potassium channel family protein [Solirubrobacteraceae bacterium]
MNADEYRGRQARRLIELKGSYRYGLVLALTVLSLGAQMLLPDTPASQLAQALLMAATVVTALYAEGATAKQWRRAGALVGVAVVGLIAVSIAGRGSTERSIMFGSGGILALAGAVIVARGVVGGIRVERRVTLHSVMGALTVYLLAGLVFAFCYAVMDEIAGTAVLSNLGADKHAEEVYFSFVTLATVGYGDIVPTAAAARMTSVLEALFGQLYLVTIVAVIVSNVGARRGSMRPPGDVVD